MTYAELATLILNMTPDQQGQDVTVYIREVEEYYPLVEDFPLVVEDGKDNVLDVGHAYLVI